MGLMQRNKGKRFERDIAARLRSVWPDAVVRRASQAERADNPDVFIEGGPPILARLWLELQDARQPTPDSKLFQAEKDADLYLRRRVGGMASPGLGGYPKTDRLPVVVWHRLGERTTWATMRLWVLDELRDMFKEQTAGTYRRRTGSLVTMKIDDAIEMLREAVKP